MGPQVERLVRQSEGIQLVRIDIDAWGSDVAQQYGIRGLPALWLYEGKTRTLTDAKAVFAKLQE